MRWKKRKWFDDFFGGFEDFIGGDIEGGFGGYSIEIRSTPEGTEVYARVYGDTDREALKRHLEDMYPGAKIVIEGGEDQRLIRRVDEHEERDVGREEGVSITFESGKPIIVKREKKMTEQKTSGEAPSVEIVFKKGKPIIKRVD